MCTLEKPESEVKEEETIVVPEVYLRYMLEHEECWCERCLQDDQKVLDVYRLWWTPDEYEVHILCKSCDQFLRAWIEKMRSLST